MNPLQSASAARDSERAGEPIAAQADFQNIDLVRLLAALVVVWFHICRSFPAATIHDYGIAKHHYLFDSILGLLFNGPAAVMLFFVISGLCINLPYRNNRPINVVEFYVRRYVRIWPPLLAAVILSGVATGRYDFSGLPIVWSLWCELFYYLLYPLLIVLITRFGFGWVFVASCVAALQLSFTGDYKQTWEYGPFLTWIIFLPVWLSGVWISENTKFIRGAKGVRMTASFGAVGAVGLFLLSIVWTIIRFHIDGSGRLALYTLWVFSAACAAFLFMFLKVDLSKNKIIAFLERQGRCSYSLYLVHLPVFNLTTKMMLGVFGIVAFSQKLLVASSFMVFGLACVTAVAFYWMVEKPSHDLAKYLGGKVRLLSMVTIRR